VWMALRRQPMVSSGRISGRLASPAAIDQRIAATGGLSSLWAVREALLSRWLAS
jgi:hypothetical protein